MAEDTVFRSCGSSDNLRTQFNALRADVDALRTKFIALLADLDTDGGVTDTDHESSHTPAAITSKDLTAQ